MTVREAIEAFEPEGGAYSTTGHRPPATTSTITRRTRPNLPPRLGPPRPTFMALTASMAIRMRTAPRGLRPFVMTNLKTLAGLQQVVSCIESRGMPTSA